MQPIAEVPFPDGVTVEDLRQRLRAAGAVFAFVHGSRAARTHAEGADLDVAAWFGRPVAAWQADRCKRYLDEAHGRADLVATVLGRG